MLRNSDFSKCCDAALQWKNIHEYECIGESVHENEDIGENCIKKALY